METGCGAVSSLGVTTEGARRQSRACQVSGMWARGGPGRQTEGRGQGHRGEEAKRRKAGGLRSGPLARCQDEVMDKGQGSHTLWTEVAFAGVILVVMKVEIKSQREE